MLSLMHFQGGMVTFFSQKRGADNEVLRIRVLLGLLLSCTNLNQKF